MAYRLRYRRASGLPAVPELSTVYVVLKSIEFGSSVPSLHIFFVATDIRC